MKHKFNLEGILTLKRGLTDSQKKEIASRLDLPDNEDNQRDLMYMSAILVSTGTNKNGAHFLGSELVRARKTISQKPLNIEHSENEIVGHITEWLYMDQSGKILDDKALYDSIVSVKGEESLDTDQEEIEKNVEKIDKIPMDIGIVCAVHRNIFPEIADDIELGRYKVSMECYYENFDIKIGEFILPRGIAQEASIDTLIESKLDGALLPVIRDVANGKSLGNIQVSRVLRGIHFCGVGLVENPANVRSLVLEAAKKLDKKSEGLVVTDGQCAVASIDITEVEVTEPPVVEMLVYEVPAKSQYSVIHSEEGSVSIDYFDDLEKAKEVAAELIFKLANISTTSQFSVTTAEICSNFSSSHNSEEKSSTAYRVVDGIVEESIETMESSKICSVIDKRDCGSEECIEIVVEDPTNTQEPEVEEEDQEGKLTDVVDEVEEVEDTVVAQVPSKRVEKVNIPLAPKKVDRAERSKLPNEAFALRNSRKFPIHTADRVEANMELFSFIKEKISTKEAEEFYKNLVISGLKCGVSTEKFEASTNDFKFLHGKDYNANYGVPRLKKFPLDTREQVISAMSRFSRLKMELSPMEKEGLFINILKAASKLGISTESFRKRVLEPSDS